uniref:Putative secreted protein n=1 Tax=Ixodes ricinus TaxID=34613 RepID=A0A147BJU7_IXORI
MARNGASTAAWTLALASPSRSGDEASRAVGQGSLKQGRAASSPLGPCCTTARPFSSCLGTTAAEEDPPALWVFLVCRTKWSLRPNFCGQNWQTKLRWPVCTTMWRLTSLRVKKDRAQRSHLKRRSVGVLTTLEPEWTLRCSMTSSRLAKAAPHSRHTGSPASAAWSAECLRKDSTELYFLPHSAHE